MRGLQALIAQKIADIFDMRQSLAEEEARAREAENAEHAAHALHQAKKCALLHACCCMCLKTAHIVIHSSGQIASKAHSLAHKSTTVNVVPLQIMREHCLPLLDATGRRSMT